MKELIVATCEFILAFLKAQDAEEDTPEAQRTLMDNYTPPMGGRKPRSDIGKSHQCGHCKFYGHNVRTCPSLKYQGEWSVRIIEDI